MLKPASSQETVASLYDSKKYRSRELAYLPNDRNKNQFHMGRIDHGRPRLRSQQSILLDVVDLVVEVRVVFLLMVNGVTLFVGVLGGTVEVGVWVDGDVLDGVVLGVVVVVVVRVVVVVVVVVDVVGGCVGQVRVVQSPSVPRSPSHS